MKNMFKMNKKGFTLVELLAVIVILALLIVITANTVLPMLNSSKNSGMVTYAERVMSKAAAQYQADSLSGSDSKYGVIEAGVAYYSIASLMESDQYFGCVKFDSSDSATNPYQILMYSNDDKLKIEGKSTNGLIKKDAVNYTSTDSFSATSFDNKGTDGADDLDECKGASFTPTDLNS